MRAEETDRHYKIGYVSGTFDMFHIGHLNLIRRAKERCDYLIAGVLTDELIGAGKGKWPVFPFADRLAIVAALRDVDRAVPTTQDVIPKLDAWREYRFDAMFSGDDWIDDPAWQAEEQELNAVGADLVYFPYTKEISTSALQELTLEKKKEDAFKAAKTKEFTYLFPFDKVERGEKIVIYGAGKVGGQYCDQLGTLDYCEVAAVVDTACTAESTFHGKPLLPPERLMDGSWYSRVVVATSVYAEGILGKLRVMGVPPEKIV